MKVKIDTKEKFHVITLSEPILAANLAADLTQVVTKLLHEEIKNVVLNLNDVTSIEEPAAEQLARLQQNFYENNASFVICNVQKEVEQQLDGFGLLELMNITPSESEAWDIVQMEEIERELMDGSDPEFHPQDN